jgi:hypothetical protein
MAICAQIPSIDHNAVLEFVAGFGQTYTNLTVLWLVEDVSSLAELEHIACFLAKY